MVLGLAGCSKSENLLGKYETNLYEQYKNCDKGFNEYCFYYTEEKTPKAFQFGKYRKKILDKIATNKEIHNIAIDKRLLGKDQYVITKNDTGYVYIGEIKDNSPNGVGAIYRMPDKLNGKNTKVPIYQGEFKDGLYNGYGILYEDSKTDLQLAAIGRLPESKAKNEIFRAIENPILKYEGEFKAGEFSGKGNLYNGISNGQSTLPEINIESGEFKKGKVKGNVCIYFNGFIWYEGGMEDGKFNGDGIKYHSRTSNIEYKGHFKNDEYDGKGILYDKNGKVLRDGKWKNGDYAS